MRVAVVGAVPLVRHGLVLQLVARGVHVHTEAASLDHLRATPSATAERGSPVLLLVGVHDDRVRTLEGIRLVLGDGSPVLALTDGGDSWLRRRAPGGRRAPDGLAVTALAGVGADEVVAWLGAAAASGRPARGPAQRPRLTAAELDVLELLAQGLSNAGIARRLSLSPKTVECHVTSLFAKLGLAHEDPGLNRRVSAALQWVALVS
ncbi:helix-turn-helix transcriptional regulator [Actinotalea solisilvae]|uniref:helix-turn-helix transcriptional regulator n=1 Tax=Actinotalea solisilvae TaxID=2072922 RepID=UPI0018F20749|nr:LuxR C-terminal-related transcriptional regulator [Actinotalea solisilvae]